MCGSSLQAFHRCLPSLLMGNASLVSAFILLQDRSDFSLLYRLFKGAQQLFCTRSGKKYLRVNFRNITHQQASSWGSAGHNLLNASYSSKKWTVLTAWWHELCVGCGSAGSEEAAPGLFQFSKPPPPKACFIPIVPCWCQALKKKKSPVYLQAIDKKDRNENR